MVVRDTKESDFDSENGYGLLMVNGANLEIEQGLFDNNLGFSILADGLRRGDCLQIDPPFMVGSVVLEVARK